MQEVTLTLKTLLEKNWNIKNPDKKDIEFRQGEPFDLATRFRRKMITVETTNVSDPIEQRTINSAKHNEICAVNVWMVILPRTEEVLNGLLEKRRNCKDEIERIILEKGRTMTDISFGFVSAWRYIDDYDADPPYLHSVCDVRCIYVKTI